MKETVSHEVEQGLVQVAGDLVNMEKVENAVMVDEGESSHNAGEPFLNRVLERIKDLGSDITSMN